MNNRKNNQEAFFALVRAGLWEKEVQLSPYGEIDFFAVQEVAEEQSVVGLVAAGLEHVVDKKPAKQEVLQFIGQTLQLEERNKAMNYFIAVTVDKMREADIYTLLVKGQAVAQCYERPLWRSSGDVDFFLNKENYKKADAFLTPLASSVDTDRGGNHGMTIGPWAVEIHDSLRCGLSKKTDKVLEDIQRDTFNGGKVRSWMNGDVQVFLLSIENDVLYVFNHFMKHFYKGGLGLRQICDWCRLLWTYRESLDLRVLESRIKQMGLMSEWKAFGAFAVEYLGMPSEAMPFLVSGSKFQVSRYSRMARRIRDFVMMSGNFGHNRDMSYYSKYPYVVRKFISMGQRIGDLFRHSLIFPLDSLRFFPKIIFDGVSSAIKGY